MRDKAPETYEEKLSQLQEVKEEAVHAGSETAVAKDARVLVIANRVESDEDIDAIERVLGAHEIVHIPEDPVIARADVEGVAPLDLDEHAPGVRALVALG